MSEIIYSRNPDTGLLNGIEYPFLENGLIDWRRMINKEFLVPNRDSFKNKDIDLKKIDIDSLPDSQLLILLGGIKELAQIRGFEKVEYKVISASMDYVAVKCTITWVSNFETCGRQVKFSALADAHLDNTKDFAKNFLMAIAENRAFIRCVRNFLRINIVGNDEIGKSSNASNDTTEAGLSEAPPAPQPIALLKQTMQKYNISFSQLKQGAIQKQIEKAESWEKEEDIPTLMMFHIISGIKNKHSNKTTT
jgi:hypothetical protein